MDATTERKILRSVLGRIDNPARPARSSRLSTLIIWVVFVAIATALLLFNTFFGPWLSAAGFLILGIAYSRALYKVGAEKAWQALVPHFSKESIEARLKDLES